MNPMALAGATSGDCSTLAGWANDSSPPAVVEPEGEECGALLLAAAGGEAPSEREAEAPAIGCMAGDANRLSIFAPLECRRGEVRTAIAGEAGCCMATTSEKTRDVRGEFCEWKVVSAPACCVERSRGGKTGGLNAAAARAAGVIGSAHSRAANPNARSNDYRSTRLRVDLLPSAEVSSCSDGSADERSG